MTNWQQGLDSRLVRRLQQPLNRKNIGQVLVDRTDKFLTRFSLVEQQFERWGRFQESNPDAVPIVYAKPTENPPGFATPLWKGGNESLSFVGGNKAIAQSPSLGSSVASGNQDLVVQRRVESDRQSDEAIAKPTAQVVNQSGSAEVIEDPPGFATPLSKGGNLGSNSRISVDSSDIVIQRFVDPTQENDLPLVEPTQLINEKSESTTSVSSSDTSSKSVEAIATPASEFNNAQIVSPNVSTNQGDVVMAEAIAQSQSPETSDLTFVSPTTQVSQSFLGEGGLRRSGVSTSYVTSENQSGDRPEISTTNTASQVIINGEKTIETARFADVPLVFALPNNSDQSAISPEIPTSTETVLPVVKTRLEQLLSRPRKPSQLETVAPKNLVRRSPQKTETPLVKPLSQPGKTDAESIELPMPTQTSVQPQPVVNTANGSVSSLPLTQTKIIQTEGRSPTPPNSTNPFGISNQTPTPIVSPQIQEATNPVTETFQAAMAEATQQPPVDIQAIANQVEKKLRKKMVIERERRGQGRWR